MRRRRRRRRGLTEGALQGIRRREGALEGIRRREQGIQADALIPPTMTMILPLASPGGPRLLCRGI